MNLTQHGTKQVRLAIFLITLSVHTAFADSLKEKNKDLITWQRLDSSNPEHAAIIGWHRTLISNDYSTYLKYAPRIMREHNTVSQSNFDSRRKITPPNILIAPIPTHINPNGSKDYAVAGCGSWKGFDKPTRLVALVTPILENGMWKISASDFAPPWNNLVHVCPESK